jgi:hypothetical protein
MGLNKMEIAFSYKRLGGMEYDSRWCNVCLLFIGIYCPDCGCGEKDRRKVLQVCSWYCPYLYWSGSDENIRGLFR